MKSSVKFFASAPFAAALSATLLSVSLAPNAFAEESFLDDLMAGSSTKVNFRYRTESVDDETKSETAIANTLKSRVTFTSGTASNFSFGLEFDDSRALFNEDFNSTTNGNTAYPVVADPEGTDLNQAYMNYSSGSFGAKLGRQRILLDDQRFVGGVGWRQNEQTYDGLNLSYKRGAFNGSYAYIENVNRIFGPTAPTADWRGDVHLLNGTYAINDAHKLTGFYYSMDFEAASARSNATLGVRYQGKVGPVGIAASYATQSDVGDNPTDYSADYMALELSGKVASKVDLKVGVEVLGSDNGAKGFDTPLATAHKFQGWADKYLGTPGNGVEDMYIGVAGKLGKVILKADYHMLSSDFGGRDYGTELDLVAVYPITSKLKGLLKYAQYNADSMPAGMTQDGLGSDIEKIWLMFELAL